MTKEISFYSGQDDETGFFSKVEEAMKNHKFGHPDDYVEIDSVDNMMFLHTNRANQPVVVCVPYYTIKPEIEHYIGGYPEGDDLEEDYIGINPDIEVEEFTTLVATEFDYRNEPVFENTSLNDADMKYGEEIFEMVDDIITKAAKGQFMEVKARAVNLYPDTVEKMFEKGTLGKEAVSFTGSSAVEVYYGDKSTTKMLVDSTIDHQKQMMTGLKGILAEEAKKTVTFIEYANQESSNMKDFILDYKKADVEMKNKPKVSKSTGMSI